MTRLTTDNPQGNFEMAMNYVYDKDGEAFIRNDGRTDNVPLWQYIDRLCKGKGCEIASPLGSEQTSERCYDCAMDGETCPVSMMYIFACQAVELRARLKKHEDAGFSPAEWDEYVKAKETGRLLIMPSENDAIIKAIEVALRIKLYDWQKAYIFGMSGYVMPGRVTGRTTAYILKLLLSKGPPLHLYKNDVLMNICDEDHGHSYRTLFKNELGEIHYRLWGIAFLRHRLRKIYFTREQARQEAAPDD